MTPDILIAGGTIVGSLTAVGGVAAWVARLVRAPIIVAVDKVRDDLTDLQNAVAHNRASADQKFVALDLRVARNSDDIINLGKADIAHALAIKHLGETMENGFANMHKRFDDLAESLRKKR